MSTAVSPGGDDSRLDPGIPLYHLALLDEWEHALAAGGYRRSTVGRSLEQEGFIHASFASQVETTAESYYAGREVVLLTIDPTRVPSEIRLDEVADGRWFPHVYGPLPLKSIVSALRVPMLADGSHDFSELIPHSP